MTVAFGGQPREEGLRARWIGEALGRERRDVGVGRVGRVAEDRLEMRVGGERGAAGSPVVGGERADEDAFVDGLEQARERGRAMAACWGRLSEGHRIRIIGMPALTSRVHANLQSDERSRACLTSRC